MEEAKTLKEQLLFKKKTAYEVMTEEAKKEMEEYSKEYMWYIDHSKTEREAVRSGIALLEKKGFVPYSMGDKIEKGGKYYFNNRGKALYAFRIGSESLEEGIRISAAHIDSPRLDLKPNPLYEEADIGYFKTHYYGGIKKYQWTTIPLAIHGVVVKKDGTKVEITVGEEESDPIFYISDLLPHLAKDQVNKTLGEGIPGEKLNVIIGSTPYDQSADGGVKLHMMQVLNEKYGIVEQEFQSAELSMVPAMKAREVGFDRSLIAGYGHDDRVCAHPAIRALADTDESVHTVMAILADKEEVGSGGNTGMQSGIFLDIMEEICKSLGANFNIVKNNSKCLSADVNAAYDPNFADVFDRRNVSLINCGVAMSKYTGHGGKVGTNDAPAEYVAWIRRIMADAGVIWQAGDVGKDDVGGAGTVAKYIAKHNIETVDLGVPVISMHAPYEIISKADLYTAHQAFEAFFRA